MKIACEKNYLRTICRSGCPHPQGALRAGHSASERTIKIRIIIKHASETRQNWVLKSLAAIIHLSLFPTTNDENCLRYRMTSGIGTASEIYDKRFLSSLDPTYEFCLLLQIASALLALQ